MQGYRTIMEKSADWNLSSRHVQYLCRQGEIKGAIKRAGAWFIPSDAPSPAKNSKRNIGEFNFTGTKKEIFNCAIDMFTNFGFDNVSLRDIAGRVGIQQSTIYNHFKSKQEILDCIYNFYCHHLPKDRPSLEQMEGYLRNESIIEIINHIKYLFHEDYLQKMADISKILFQRIGVDSRAKEIAKALVVDEGVKYVEAVFNIGVHIGRFAPFDTHVMSVFINSVRIYTLYHWIVDPSPQNFERLMKDEQALYNFVTALITDLGPVNGEKIVLAAD